MVGINYEQTQGDQAREMVRQFVAAHKIPYPCVIGDLHTRRQVRGLNAFPTTLFVDRTGKVRFMLEGYTPESELEAIVTALLDEKS